MITDGDYFMSFDFLGAQAKKFLSTSGFLSA